MKGGFYTVLMFLALTGPAHCTSFPFMDTSAIERGRKVFMEACRVCHGLKYYRDRAHPQGITALMDEASLREGFGMVPPDLSLITSARGRGTGGALYVYRLLTGYYREDGVLKNRALKEWRGGDGVTAMPPPLPEEGLKEKARDVAVFLHHVADPKEAERRSIGRYVLGYTTLMTILLYLIYRRVWRALKKLHRALSG